MRRTYDTIVLGGGAIGCTVAWRLAQRAMRVLVLERGRIGGEASSAAAGMLGAQLEVGEPGPFYRLCVESRGMYPAFAQALLEDSGIDIQYVHNGILQVAHRAEEVDALRRELTWQTAEGARAEWIHAQDIPALEPDVSPGLGGLFLPDDGNVSAPLLMRALARAVHRRCDVREGAEVTAVSAESGRVDVRTVEETFSADHLVVAAGAWAGRFVADLGVNFFIRPVKGQLLAVRPRAGHGLTRTLHTHQVYLVPKRDGTIVVGATEEHGAGYNRDLTADAILRLLQGLRHAAPGLADAMFDRAWVGLRPGSPKGEPLLGPVPEHPNVHLAVGHFRNGILLSPVTGAILEASILGDPWPERWRPFTVAAWRDREAAVPLGAEKREAHPKMETTTTRGEEVRER
ncbi:glycine oxidase ThiO [Alicyclobacillus sp.]|uniref:glycine oxidase ThiO n=1 Tax=Alicyclobacillus sp. TaxID=61169 RepID=UPI0025C60D62|nr:glycine oxidase ThiO [Alicyclobacillus sp.]MCL6516098.1 glycine oxidase ThiO [Alicyclobacillus sp.]